MDFVCPTFLHIPQQKYVAGVILIFIGWITLTIHFLLLNDLTGTGIMLIILCFTLWARVEHIKYAVKELKEENKELK